MVNPIQDYKLIEKKSDRHFVFQDQYGNLKFVKLLRSNSGDRCKELISELLTERVFNKLGISDLSPIIISYEERPAILMRYKSDLNRPVTVDLSLVKVKDREYFATALFVGDKLVKNTNRSKNRRDHIGWEDAGDGAICLCPLDNGHSLGFDSQNMEDDSDLDNFLDTEHFSFEITSSFSLEQIKRVITCLNELNFDTLKQAIYSQIFEILLPTDEEKHVINEYITRTIEMLNRRKPKIMEFINKFTSTISSTVVLPTEKPVQVI